MIENNDVLRDEILVAYYSSHIDKLIAKESETASSSKEEQIAEESIQEEIEQVREPDGRFNGF